MELHVPGVLEAVEHADPDHPALVHAGRTWTRRQVGDRCRQFAHVLARAGLGRSGPHDSLPRWSTVQDRVALYLHTGPEYLECMVGAWVAGAVAVNVNYRYVADELTHVLDDAGVRAVVVHGRYSRTLADVLPRLRRRPELILQVPDSGEEPLLPGARWYEDAVGSAPAAPEARWRDEWSGDDRYLCYTGGTTGLPKGVLWRQADFLVAALGVRHRDGSDHESIEEAAAAASGRVRALPAPPFMHGAAHWNALSCWVAGGTVVLPDHPDRVDPADLVAVAAREDVTSLLLVGDPMACPLVDELRRNGATLPSLRHIVSGGAVLSPATRAQLLELLPGVTIIDVLGSTESGRQGVATVDATTPRDHGFSPSTTSVILDEHRSRVLAPDDHSVGWLAQRGRVPVGYLGDPERSEATFPEIDGVRHAVPGDRARWRDDGTIELLGRDSVCVNTGGEKVFVEEVEQALRLHPDVMDVVVCGRPSERWGEEVVAVVQLRDGSTATDRELIAAAGGSVARYKLPKAILRVPGVVRSPSGKADYRWARRVAAGAGLSPSSRPRSG